MKVVEHLTAERNCNLNVVVSKGSSNHLLISFDEIQDETYNILRDRLSVSCSLSSGCQVDVQ